MFMNETRYIRDFSTGEKIRYEPIKWLWQALRGEGTYSGAYPFTFRQPIKHKIAFKSTILYPFIP